MWLNGLTHIIFISVLYNFSLVTSHECFVDNILCIDRVRQAVQNYPKDQEYLMCELKMALIEKNQENSLYTDCVNLARTEFTGPMSKSGKFNPINNFKMGMALRKKQFRKALSLCIDLLNDCYDVNNLKLCLDRHEQL